MGNKKSSEHLLSFEYSQITDEIFIGTNMCCQTHFDKGLLVKGVSADISLDNEKVDSPFGVDFFSWIPVVDHEAPSEVQFELGVVILDKLVKLKKKVYVHCVHGHGRAPTMVAAYFVSRGDSVQGAIEGIKQKRPSIHLDDVQIEALEKFSKKKK